MITEATAVALRQNLGDMLNRVQYRRDSIVITKDDAAVSAVRKEMKAEAAVAKGRAAKRTSPATPSTPAKSAAARKTGAARHRAR